jgi:hypothetical protein
MQNTGTWNSDLALLMFAALMFPIAMYFLKAVLDSMRHGATTVAKDTNNYTETDENYSPTTINITNKYYSRRPTRSKPKAKTKKKANKRTPLIDDVVSGLVNMGYKKREALIVAQSISEKNNCSNAEELLKECLKR